MNLIYLYPIFFILIFITTKYKKHKKIFLSFLGLYFLAGVSACYIYNNIYKYSIKPLVLHAIVYHLLLLFCLLFPLSKYDVIKDSVCPKVKNTQLLDCLSYIIIFLSLLTIITKIPKINLALFFNDIQELRVNLISGDTIESNLLIRYLTFYATNYWSVALVLAFYYMVHYPYKKWVIIFLIISSYSIIVSSLVVAGRESLLKYLLIWFILFYFMKSRMDNHWLLFQKRMIKILGALFILFFLIITFLRFNGDSVDGLSIIDSIFAYLGQGFVNFSSYFVEFYDDAIGGKLHFPFFVGGRMSSFNLNDNIITDLQLNTFSTTIGTWVLDVGWIWTIIIAIIHFILFDYIGHCRINIFKIIYVIWIYEFMFSCLFFYNEAITGARLLGILFIVIMEKLCMYKKI